MSPRRPHLRNRKNIKAPKRFQDADIIPSSPLQESHKGSEESSELEEEVYQSPKTKKPKSKPPAYHGAVIEFDPNLPPAAFPTLDHPNYVHNGGNIPIHIGSRLPGLQSQEPRLAGPEAVNTDSLGRACHDEEIHLTRDLPIMKSTTTDFTVREPQIVKQTSITVQKRARARMPSSIYGESTDNGPRNPIWASNMARMEEAGKMSHSDRIILEMETSDEEDTAAGPTKVARTASVPVIPTWNDLTVAHKLNLADTIARLHQLHPDPEEVMHQLRLSDLQKEELVKLLTQRQDRAAREVAKQQKLPDQMKDVRQLLLGRPLSQSTFHQMVQDHPNGTIDEDDRLPTNLTELKKARAYLEFCGFDPALADDSWDVPHITNGASGIKPRPAQTKPKTSLSSTAALIPPRHSEGPLSRQPTRSTHFQQASHPPDPRLELVQHTQEALPQHRPTPAHTQIAQHSRAAPLFKVPVQPFRVAPSNQNGDLHARYQQGTVRISQPAFKAFPVQPNASIGLDLRGINKALLNARGASSASPSLQEEHSLPEGPYSMTPTGLPTARRNQGGQSSGNPNVGVSARQKEHSLPEGPHSMTPTGLPRARGNKGGQSSGNPNVGVSARQEERSLPEGPYSMVPKPLPIARRNPNNQSSGNVNVGTSAPQGTGRSVGDRDLANKKKRKRIAT